MAQVRAAFRPYVDDAVLDIAARPGRAPGSRAWVARLDAGTGSVGMGRYYLLVGPEGFAGAADLPLCHVVEVVWQDRHWLVRSRHHARVSLEPEDLCLLPSHQDLSAPLRHYAAACGQALALAHARGDRRSTRFEAAMARGLKAEGAALIAAGRAQARQSEADCDLLREMLAGN